MCYPAPIVSVLRYVIVILQENRQHEHTHRVNPLLQSPIHPARPAEKTPHQPVLWVLSALHMLGHSLTSKGPRQVNAQVPSSSLRFHPAAYQLKKHLTSPENLNLLMTFDCYQNVT